MRDRKARRAGRADFMPAATDFGEPFGRELRVERLSRVVGCLTLARFKNFEYSNLEFVSDFVLRIGKFSRIDIYLITL